MKYFEIAFVVWVILTIVAFGFTTTVCMIELDEDRISGRKCLKKILTNTVFWPFIIIGLIVEGAIDLVRGFRNG